MSKQKQTEEGSRVVVKKKGGCGTFLAGFFCAIIFLVLLIGGAGAYVYFCVNLQQVESVIGVKLPIEGDLNKKTIKDLISLGLDVKDSYVHMKVRDLKDKVGIDLEKTLGKIPGTDISLEFLYSEDTTVKFKGSTVKFLDIEVMDAVNDSDSLVDGVLELLYDRVTVGEILSTAQLTETVNNLDWPAVKDEIYDVSGTKKNLSSLTINEAKDVLVDYYGADNLTINKLIEATNIVAIPNKPKYDTLRALKVQKITTKQLLDNITGEILNDLFTLTDFEFTQTEEFNNTALSGMVDYIETLPLGDFIKFENAVKDDYFDNHAMFNSLKTVYVSKLNDEILKLKINQILTSTQISRTSLSASEVAITLPQLLDAKPSQTIENLFGTENINEVGAYIKALKDCTNANFLTSFSHLAWGEKLGIDSGTALLDISDLTIKNIAESEDIPNTIFEELGTLGDLVGSTDNSIMQLISRVKLTDLLTDAGNAITNALEYDEHNNLNTLATLLNITDTTGINGIVSSIKVKDLLDTPNEAISNALESSTLSLAELLGMTSTSGINGVIGPIKLNELFTNPDTAIKTALSGCTDTLKDFLGATTTPDTIDDYILSEITVANLFDETNIATTLTTKINNMPLRFVLGTQPSTGFLSLIDPTYYTNATVGGIQTLMESVDVANITLGTLIDKQVIELDYAVFSDPSIVNGMRGLTLMDILEAYYIAVRDGQITP